MKVLMVYDDPIVMDLVAHFLGIATHHNDNVAPSAILAPIELERLAGLKHPRHESPAPSCLLRALPFCFPCTHKLPIHRFSKVWSN